MITKYLDWACETHAWWYVGVTLPASLLFAVIIWLFDSGAAQ